MSMFHKERPVKKSVIKLPAPDAYGNYWLADVAGYVAAPGAKRQDGPAIFVSARDVRKIIEKNTEGVKARYFASLGDRADGGGFGILCDGDGIRYFETPPEALDALQAEWDRQTKKGAG